MVTVTVSIDCLLEKTWTGVPMAVPRARVAVDPLKVTVGRVVYPEPGLVIVTDTTPAVPRVAVAVAAVVGAPPPLNVTFGMAV
jgi:hypothetical protein